MATTIGTFTIQGTSPGNLPNYYDAWNYLSNDFYAGSGSGMLTSGTISQVLDQLIGFYYQQYTGSITYTLDGPDSFGTGVDTVVTMTFTDLFTGATEVYPYFLIFVFEDVNYSVIWQTTNPVTPTLCNDCQFIQLTQCGTDDFRLDLGLTDGPYIAYYTDNTSGVVWEQGTYSSQAQGGLSMYHWSATEGMFNPYSFYTMTLTDNTGAPISWTIDGIEYTCATLTFRTTVNVTD